MDANFPFFLSCTTNVTCEVVYPKHFLLQQLQLPLELLQQCGCQPILATSEYREAAELGRAGGMQGGAERLRRCVAVAVLLNLAGIVDALHAPPPVCAPAKIDLACGPGSEIVTMDGSPARNEFRHCVPRYCSDLPVVADGTAAPVSPIDWNGKKVVAKGDAAQISCNAGYALAGSGSAQPRCLDGCRFETPDTCVPIKCAESFQDPNGVVNGGPLVALPDRSYLEFDEYVRITCNHGYMASDSSHSHSEPCKVSYVRECRADGSLTNAGIRCVPLVCQPIDLSDRSLQYNRSGTLVAAATYQPAGPQAYKDRVNLTCSVGFYIAGGSPQRECAWTCQYTDSHAHCTASTCNTTLRGIKSHLDLTLDPDP